MQPTANAITRNAGLMAMNVGSQPFGLVEKPIFTRADFAIIAKTMEMSATILRPGAASTNPTSLLPIADDNRGARLARVAPFLYALMR